MSTHSSTIVAAATVLALGASTGMASAQGYGYGSASGTAAALGFTASPPIARNGNVPVVAAPVYEPVTTGSIAPRDRAWTRLHRR